MRKKILTIAIILVVLFTGVSVAQAGIFDGISSFFNNLFNDQSVPAVEKEDVPLYKPVIDYEQAVTSAVEQSIPSVVSIAISKNVQTIERCAQQFGPFEVLQPCPGQERNVEVGEGSGFIVSEDGLVATNKHVVRDEGATYEVFTNDGQSYEAEVLDRDPVQDIAILKINASDLTPAKLGGSDSIKLGQTAIAIGNSLGEFKNTVSVGVVSGLSRDITAAGSGGFVERIEGVIQTDAAINQGNSGGPLINLKGEVIGMNTAVAQGAQNVGFAIPIDRIKRDVRSVQETGEIKTPFLGVRYIQITPRIAEQENLPVESGVLVRGSQDGPAVVPGSAADEAGIQPEDIIIEFNGVEINDENSLGSLIHDHTIGDTVTITVLRNGQEITLETSLKERPDF